MGSSGEHGGLIRFLSDALLLSACCVFAVSVVEPFMTRRFVLNHWGQAQVIVEATVTHWSYQAVVVPSIGERLLFSEYWFGSNPFVPMILMDMSGLFISLFIVQTLTIVTGLFSLLARRVTRAIPMIFSVVAVALIVRIFVEANSALGFADYGYGYWLVYPSIFMFCLAFAFSRVAKRAR